MATKTKEETAAVDPVAVEPLVTLTAIRENRFGGVHYFAGDKVRVSAKESKAFKKSGLFE